MNKRTALRCPVLMPWGMWALAGGVRELRGGDWQGCAHSYPSDRPQGAPHPQHKEKTKLFGLCYARNLMRLRTNNCRQPSRIHPEPTLVNVDHRQVTTKRCRSAASTQTLSIPLPKWGGGVSKHIGATHQSSRVDTKNCELLTGPPKSRKSGHKIGANWANRAPIRGLAVPSAKKHATSDLDNLDDKVWRVAEDFDSVQRGQ